MSIALSRKGFHQAAGTRLGLSRTKPLLASLQMILLIFGLLLDLWYPYPSIMFGGGSIWGSIGESRYTLSWKNTYPYNLKHAPPISTSIFKSTIFSVWYPWSSPPPHQSCGLWLYPRINCFCKYTWLSHSQLLRLEYEGSIIFGERFWSIFFSYTMLRSKEHIPALISPNPWTPNPLPVCSLQSNTIIQPSLILYRDPCRVVSRERTASSSEAHSARVPELCSH